LARGRESSINSIILGNRRRSIKTIIRVISGARANRINKGIALTNASSDSRIPTSDRISGLLSSADELKIIRLDNAPNLSVSWPSLVVVSELFLL
jgi:hypothetical protein